jgi:hypothetical protein
MQKNLVLFLTFQELPDSKKGKVSSAYGSQILRRIQQAKVGWDMTNRMKMGA